MPDIVQKKNAYVGFNCFVVYNNKEIYGPFQPTLASGSNSTIPSCHAEVHAAKYIYSIKGTLKGATFYVIRWSYNKIINDWELNNCVPCQDCANYFKKNNVNKFVISNKDGFIKCNLKYILENTKPSNGRLYGT